MAGLKIPSGAASPSTRFVYTVRPRPQGPRSERPQPIEEPLAIPEMDLSERIEDCKRRISGFRTRGEGPPQSMERELENLLTEAANALPTQN